MEEIFIQLQKAIEVYSSLGYVVKSYYHKILMLMYEKHDYYGSQYEIDRMLKIVSY